MTTWKRCMLIITSVIFLQNANAQKLPATLLWKINGNGLESPSFLYGTMHLTDERVFELGDSLYQAIDQSEGLAIEINPSEFTGLLIGEMKKATQKHQSVFVKDILPPEQFRKYAANLGKKFNKDAEEVTLNDIRNEKDKWMEERISNGKMKTFLDIYLFDIARRKGKYTGGVEDAGDQANLPDPVMISDIEFVSTYGDSDQLSTGEEDAGGNEFINAYLRGDLDFIDSISMLADTAYLDAVLIKRNLKMAFRIDSISRRRSTVFAIGAAHLPGNDGLIKLLKEKGYDVTPVFSSKKISPVDYHVEEAPVRWEKVKDDDGYYTASMPGEAGTADFYSVMKMKVFYDVFSSTVYMTTAVVTPVADSLADDFIEQTAAQYFETEDLGKRRITVNGVRGMEFTTTSGFYARAYILLQDGKLYMAMARSMKKDTAAAGDITRFLRSFTILPRPVEVQSYTLYENTERAYQVRMPGTRTNDDELPLDITDSTVTSELHASFDAGTGAYFLLDPVNRRLVIL